MEIYSPRNRNRNNFNVINEYKNRNKDGEQNVEVSLIQENIEKEKIESRLEIIKRNFFERVKSFFEYDAAL